MAEPQFRRMTEEEFLDWHERQEYRYELVNGFPIQIFPPKGMTGWTRNHNRVAHNISFALTPPARAKGCTPVAHNAALRAPRGNLRYPDVVVDCGEQDGRDRIVNVPTIVAEVRSPTNTAADITDKLEEYQAHPAIRVIMWIESEIVSVKLYRRGDNGWTIERYYRLDRTIPLPEIDGELSVAEIYYGLDPEIGPDLAIVD